MWRDQGNEQLCRKDLGIDLAKNLNYIMVKIDNYEFDDTYDQNHNENGLVDR